MKHITEEVLDLHGIRLTIYVDEDGHKWFSQTIISTIIGLPSNDYYYYVRSNAVDPDEYFEHREREQLHLKGTRIRITPVPFLSALFYWKHNAETKNNEKARFLYEKMKDVTNY